MKENWICYLKCYNNIFLKTKKYNGLIFNYTFFKN